MKIRFVVVDDAAFLRELIKNIVSEDGGLCVGEASNGDEAMAVVGASLPDVVFLDMVMPLKNGIETATHLKQFHPEIKIIGCSTVDQDALVRQAYVAGFDAYITKPFTKEDINNALANVFPHLGEFPHGRT